VLVPLVLVLVPLVRVLMSLVRALMSKARVLVDKVRVLMASRVKVMFMSKSVRLGVSGALGVSMLNGVNNRAAEELGSHPTTIKLVLELRLLGRFRRIRIQLARRGVFVAQHLMLESAGLSCQIVGSLDVLVRAMSVFVESVLMLVLVLVKSRRVMPDLGIFVEIVVGMSSQVVSGQVVSGLCIFVIRLAGQVTVLHR
jgi:hypothetical protein